MNVMTKEIQTHWQAIGPVLTIQNEAEYDRAIERLNTLIDEIGTDERHSLYNLMDTLGTLIHAYDETHYVIPTSNSIDTLKYLMDEHDLRQSDLSEIGSQNVVSKILSGEQELDVQQIQILSQRFSVSPAVFF